MNCPICAGDTLIEFNGRPRARCADCSSMERTRYVWLYLQHAGVVRAGRTLWHFGPERALMRPLLDALGDGYRPMDLHPAVYKNDLIEVRQFDLLEDLPAAEADSVDVILANHILEHLPCPVEDVLAQFMRVLRPGGDMVITVPISGRPDTIEDLDPALSDEERTRRFGQYDHMRLFGQDFREFIADVVGRDIMIDGRELFGEDQLEDSGIPAANVSRPSSESIFHYQKPGQ